MRLMLLGAAASLALAACGGPDTSQVNNAQANISNTARPAQTAAPSEVGTSAAARSASVPMSPVTGHEAKALKRERHEDRSH